MGCTSGVLKCILNTVNLLLAMSGILLIAFASLSLKTAPMPYIIFLYVVGGMYLLASILGCCGICNENICLTVLYAIMILVLLVATLYNKFKPWDINEIKKLASDGVVKSWQDELSVPGSMDKTQNTYSCCGKMGPDDYRNIGRIILPTSCYKNHVINANDLFLVGCIKAAEDAFIKVFEWARTGEWVVIGITGAMLLFSVYLIFRFRSRQERYRY